MKILVTGSGGQLGQTIMNSSHHPDHEFVFTVHRPSGGAEDNLVQLDVTDREAVRRIVRDNGIELIINCAGYTDVAKAEIEPEKAFLINSTAVSYLAEAAKENNAVLFHISTDYVFDGTASAPYREEDAALPVSVYGRSKLAGEEAVTASGCRFMIFRTAWLFSLYGRNFVKTILGKSETQASISVVSDQIGTPTYASDLVEAIFDIIDGNMLDREGIYNYTNEGVCSWYDFAKEICAVKGSPAIVVPCSTNDYPSNVRRPQYSVLDKRKFKETFNHEIPHWRDSLSFCIKEIEKFG